MQARMRAQFQSARLTPTRYQKCGKFVCLLVYLKGQNLVLLGVETSSPTEHV